VGCKITGIESLVSGLIFGIKVRASIHGWFGVVIGTCRVRRRAVGGEIGFGLERRATICSTPRRLKKLCDRHQWYQSIRK
jgi:hypothetical protein